MPRLPPYKLVKPKSQLNVSKLCKRLMDQVWTANRKIETLISTSVKHIYPKFAKLNIDSFTSSASPILQKFTDERQKATNFQRNVVHVDKWKIPEFCKTVKNDQSFFKEIAVPFAFSAATSLVFSCDTSLIASAINLKCMTALLQDLQRTTQLPCLALSEKALIIFKRVLHSLILAINNLFSTALQQLALDFQLGVLNDFLLELTILTQLNALVLKGGDNWKYFVRSLNRHAAAEGNFDHQVHPRSKLDYFHELSSERLASLNEFLRSRIALSLKIKAEDLSDEMCRLFPAQFKSITLEGKFSLNGRRQITLQPSLNIMGSLWTFNLRPIGH